VRFNVGLMWEGEVQVLAWEKRCLAFFLPGSAFPVVNCKVPERRTSSTAVDVSLNIFVLNIPPNAEPGTGFGLAALY